MCLKLLQGVAFESGSEASVVVGLRKPRMSVWTLGSVGPGISAAPLTATTLAPLDKWPPAASKLAPLITTVVSSITRARLETGQNSPRLADRTRFRRQYHSWALSALPPSPQTRRVLMAQTRRAMEITRYATTPACTRETPKFVVTERRSSEPDMIRSVNVTAMTKAASKPPKCNALASFIPRAPAQRTQRGPVQRSRPAPFSRVESRSAPVALNPRFRPQTGDWPRVSPEPPGFREQVQRSSLPRRWSPRRPNTGHQPCHSQLQPSAAPTASGMRRP